MAEKQKTSDGKSGAIAPEAEHELSKRHPLYIKYVDEWLFLNAAYEGVRALIAYGALDKHERESETNYQRRRNEAYGFSYSKSVVDIFNSYLFKKEFPETIPSALAKDDQFQAFMKDCDFEGTEFDEFFINEQRNASIQGHVGILVDKPRTDVPVQTKAQELANEIYPYVAAYKPPAILDWEYERDESGKKRLAKVVLLDDDDDKQYRVWTRDKWQIYQIVAADNKSEGEVLKVQEPHQQQRPDVRKGQAYHLVAQGDNPLGEIPFVWLYNQRSNVDPQVGISDIVDVSRIDASIVRNLSQIEEVINYAAFPMMRKAKPEATGAEAQAKDEVGPTAVLEFDPELPDSKPDWLEAAVDGPVKAILEVIAKKISEIYRASNIGGMSATEISTSAKSGVALKTEFQLLNSKLVKKGKNVAKAKGNVVRLWLKWQGLEQNEAIRKELKFEHVASFELEDLATDLENILTASAIVKMSPEFKKEIQKLVVRMILPTLDDETLAAIDKEIDDGDYEGINTFFSNEGGDANNQQNQPPNNQQNQGGQQNVGNQEGNQSGSQAGGQAQ